MTGDMGVALFLFQRFPLQVHGSIRRARARPFPSAACMSSSVSLDALDADPPLLALFYSAAARAEHDACFILDIFN